jgi:DNA polymerase (family X)
MSAGTRQPREKILRLCERIEAEIRPELEPMVSAMEWAGSIRREKPTVGDLDLVIRLRAGMPDAGVSAAIRHIAADNTLLLDGQTKKSLRLRGSGIKLEVYIARDATEDLLCRIPSDWGIILHTATGSLAWNVKVCRVAADLGLRYSPFTGLVRLADGVVLPCETEEQLFGHLGLPFVPPPARSL